jgi:hypothetical protein
MSEPFDTTGVTPVGYFDLANRAEAAIRLEAERQHWDGGYVGEMVTTANNGYVQECALGSIYYYEQGDGDRPRAHCYAVRGDPHSEAKSIDAKYRALGGPEGWLGYPTTSTVKTADGLARFNKFEHGRIYSSGAGAYSIHGDIRRRWTDLGEGSLLGYPTTDEMTTPDGIGLYNHFQNGSIYWTPDTGAYEVHGAIRDKWAALGWEQSYLGYPVSDELGTEQGGRVNGFQRGEIRWTEAGGAVDFPATVQLNANLVTDTSVGGSSSWTMNSRGEWRWTGHLHNSGFVGFDVAVATRLNFVDDAGNGYATTAAGSVDGTTSSGDNRNFNWEQFGQADGIRDNWDRGVAANGITTRVEVDVTVGDVLSLVFSGVMIVGTVLFALSGPPNKVRPCPGHRTWDGQESPGSVTIYKEGDPPPRCPDEF